MYQYAVPLVGVYAQKICVRSLEIIAGTPIRVLPYLSVQLEEKKAEIKTLDDCMRS